MDGEKQPQKKQMKMAELLVNMLLVMKKTLQWVHHHLTMMVTDLMPLDAKA
jgi:hypothetical protein